MAIAANHVKHPETMAAQRELWSKSKRDTILFRIAGLVMRGGPVPAWVTAAKRKAQALSRLVQSSCKDWIDDAEKADRAATGQKTAINQYRAATMWLKDKTEHAAREKRAALVRRLFGFAFRPTTYTH